MTANVTNDFLAGVIEGFYGQPWSQAERLELFDWMAAWGLNTYLYAPKDDLKHRALWRELYSPAEAQTVKELIQACRRRNVRFVYALSPGLDIRYSQEAEVDHLTRRIEQMFALGCENFSLLFDDIPDRMDSADLRRWDSLAAAQCYVANTLFRWLRERKRQARFLFCPTPYCSRMVRRQHGGKDYLPTIGRELAPEIDVFWTGPEIISREITLAHVQKLHGVLRRKPLIWDNLHANDYDGRRFYCGPYAGRAPELRSATSGLLSNPNCEFALNYVPLRTMAEFLQHRETWSPREAYLAAMREWLPRFATVAQPITWEQLVLFGDCHYLPHEDGQGAETFYRCVRSLLCEDAGPREEPLGIFRQQARSLREFCAEVAGLRQRPLFYALSRRIWELREELELIEQFIEGECAWGRRGDPSLTFHLPGTYRGGMVAKLQRLLIQNPDGTFTPRCDDSLSQPKERRPSL